MRIRLLRPDELDRFAALHANPAANAETRMYLDRQLEAGHIRLEWCFVAEEGEQCLGRLAYWGLAGAQLPEAIALLDLPWDERAAPIGQRLLSETLAPFAAQGAPHVDYSLREPSPWHRLPERQRPMLEQLGFRLMREAKRYDWASSQMPLPHSPSLSYRARGEVGDEAFAEAIARVSEGTLDGWIATEREELGPEEAARSYLRGSQTLRSEPGWWQLGSTADGQLAGLIMMSANNAGPVVDYIGVVPEQRGKGLVDDLLAQGLRAVQLSGEQSVRADTDTRNWPIQHALERAGFRPVATQWDYQLRLNRPAQV
jgi:ribosomal protein S18 acetylase RimI-like enzyme